MATTPLRTQVFAKRHIAAPIARRCAHIAHHQPSQCRLARLRVLEVHAIVADLRIRQRDDLACIAGIADNLEIPLKRGVEAYLAKGLPAAPHAVPKNTVPSSKAKAAFAPTPSRSREAAVL